MSGLKVICHLLSLPLSLSFSLPLSPLSNMYSFNNPYIRLRKELGNDMQISSCYVVKLIITTTFFRLLIKHYVFNVLYPLKISGNGKKNCKCTALKSRGCHVHTCGTFSSVCVRVGGMIFFNGIYSAD